MNKKQKALLVVSVTLFLIITLNRRVFEVALSTMFGSQSNMFADPRWWQDSTPFFDNGPAYEYWAGIAVPTALLFYLLKDPPKKD
jgi:hypothetical protein